MRKHNYVCSILADGIAITVLALTTFIGLIYFGIMAAAGRLVKVKQQLRSCAFRKVLTNVFEYNKKTECYASGLT